jgi:hypothetical protein
MMHLSLIRIGTYGVFAAILVLCGRQLRVIPAALVGGDDVLAYETAKEGLRKNNSVFSFVGFEGTKRSGSEIFSIAATTAEKNGKLSDGFGRPDVRLRNIDGRLVWILDYIDFLGPAQFRVTVDDQTGVATFTNTTAPL